MKILLTGAGGFIGSHLCDNLSKEHKVYKIHSTPVAGNNSYTIDLTKRKAVKNHINALPQEKVDVIIHLASKMASQDKAEDLGLFEDNIAISENLVFLAKKVKPKILINFSSMAVYPNISGLFSEESLPAPQKNSDCIYGLSKYCSEVIIDFLLRNENICIAHLRIAQVHGKGMRKDRIIPIMRKELKGHNTITVFGNGQRESNFIKINKLVEVVEYFLKHEVSGAFNVGDQNISYLELAQELINQYGNKNSTIKKEPRGIKEKFILDVSKLESLHRA